MKQSLSLPNTQNNVINKLEDLCLAAFDRAAQVARAYQYFRIKRVDVQFKPFADTFSNSTTQSVPYLHWLIMKGDALDPLTFNAMRDAGAKPIRFDEKTLNVKFRPFVQQQVIGEGAAGAPPPSTAWGMSRVSPWLSTTYQPATDSIAWIPSKVPHTGLFWGVQQDYSTITQYYDVTVTAHFEFKKPLGINPPTGTAPTGVSLLGLDDQD